MQFIEITDKIGRRNSVNVEHIRQVIEYENTCFIITSEDPKRGYYGFETQESYQTVMAMIRNK